MSAHRYWRITGIDTPARTGLSLTELRMYDATGVIDAAATVTASFAPVIGSIAMLTDGSAAGVVRWDARVMRPGFAITWDFGTEVEPRCFAPGAAASRGEFIAQATLQWSDDAASWTSIRMFGTFVYPGDYTLSALFYGDFDFNSVSLLLRNATNTTTFAPQDFSLAASVINTAGSVASDVSDSSLGWAALAVSSGSFMYTAPTAGILGPGDFTVEYWIKTTGNFQNVVSSNHPGDPSATYRAGITSGHASWDPSGSGATSLLIGTSNVSDGSWHHVAFARAGGALRIFVDGVLENSAADSANYSGVAAGVLYIAVTEGGSNPFSGLLREVRITSGVARYSSNFAVPATPLAYGAAPFGPLVLNTDSLRVNRMPGLTPPIGFKTDRIGVNKVRDVEFSGGGVIAGLVDEVQTPSNIPLRRKVRLMRESDGVLVNETWSDATTGAYSFTDINRGYVYTVIAYDYEHSFRAVIADNITPVAA